MGSPRRHSGLWQVVLALAFALLLPLPPGFAQQAPAPPLPDEQVNRIVQTVTTAVLKELKAEEPAAPPDAPAAPDARPVANVEEGLMSLVEDEEYDFVGHFETAVRAIPAVIAEAGRILARTDAGPEGLGSLAFAALLGGILATGVALASAASAIAARVLPGAPPEGGSASVLETLRRAAATFAGYGVFWLVMAIAVHKLFTNEDTQSQAGQWLLVGSAQFAFYYTLFLIWFRPSEPAYRIVPLEGDDARLAMRLFTAVMAVVVLRSWISLPMADGQPQDVISAGLLLNNLAFIAVFFLVAWPARGAIRRWIENTSMDRSTTRLRRWLAMHWLSLAGIGVLAISAIHAFGAVEGHYGVASGMAGTVRTVLAMILICAVVEFVGRRSERPDHAARRATPKLPGLVSKMLRVFIVLGATIYFIRLWFVDALQAMTAKEWSELADYAFEPLAAIFGTYLAITYVNFLSARYLALHPVTAAKVTEDGGVISRPDDSSRLRTLIPIMRITAVIVIIVVMGLVTLSHLGFNITPLLAGASVLGLAISFGSQALVKDIVSGVLFLAEDSFRVGEYIECGKSIGTVEGFTLRSLRLRHQDGHIYTVPFGQIGEITNYSRDWSTVNFSMSLDRDADLDDVRRVTKRVAGELKAEFQDRLLDPLTVQGVKDVTDDALVVLFKFTSLPLDPAEIERTARIRLLKAFREEGIDLSRRPWARSAAGQPA